MAQQHPYKVTKRGESMELPSGVVITCTEFLQRMAALNFDPQFTEATVRNMKDDGGIWILTLTKAQQATIEKGFASPKKGGNGFG